MSLAITNNPTDCTLSLYKMDRRVSDTKPVDSAQMVVSVGAAAFSKSMIFTVAGVDGEDTKLMEAMFSQAASYNVCRLFTTADPDVSLLIKMGGDRFTARLMGSTKDEVPLEKPVKLSISETTLEEEKNYELDCEAIKISKDRALIALFNSHFFKSFEQHNLETGSWRKVVKLGDNKT